MWKECKIIMLPTAKATWPNCIWLGRISKQLRLDTSYNNSPKSIEPIDDSMLPQHLYIISFDEEIKKGGWYYNSKNSTVNQLTSHYGNIKESVLILNNNKYCHKVIASTDSSLLVDKYPNESNFHMNVNLSKIPQQFIEEYIEEYNKGNVIKNVEVEYEKLYSFEASDNFDEVGFCGTRIKISKDNFISLRRKETKLYTKEEVQQLINSFGDYHRINWLSPLTKNWLKHNNL